MKYLSSFALLIVLATTVSGCLYTTPHMYQVPAGYHRCSTDYECSRRNHEYCGFVGVDSPSVCRH